MLKSAVMSLLLSMSADARPQLPAGVSAAQCPNYPLCNVGQQDLSIFTPAQQAVIRQHNAIAQANLPLPEVPGLAEHQAAEAEVLAAQGINPGSLSHAQAEARVLQFENELIVASGF
ncbi:uncharacterized protein LOC111697629 [Eurytemora carolleeae]|uniref:uncharacterized protein LOC111697629 n=1 Tax=Eurytemora carolleeae TaxID=1294199 RepID=UPI000C78CD1A|nr:uncharacterized protein LOC111697629 [Eurytemora carolleeae]|eukprot:XP_023323462.1 uncharacterized protein LOC111697629 [Eurytemora affinis]